MKVTLGALVVGLMLFVTACGSNCNPSNGVVTDPSCSNYRGAYGYQQQPYYPPQQQPMPYQPGYQQPSPYGYPQQQQPMPPYGYGH